MATDDVKVLFMFRLDLNGEQWNISEHAIVLNNILRVNIGLTIWLVALNMGSSNKAAAGP